MLGGGGGGMPVGAAEINAIRGGGRVLPDSDFGEKGSGETMFSKLLEKRPVIRGGGDGCCP